MERVVPLAPKGRALDLGCGEGRNAIYLEQHGFAVDAVDLDPIAVSRAESRVYESGCQGVDVRCIDINAALVGTSYAVVLAYGLLHCLPRRSLNSVFDFVGKQNSGAIFAASALTSDIPPPLEHGTGYLHLRSPQEYATLIGSACELVYWEEGIIEEDHLPVIGKHLHSSVWFIARVV
jgi:SAM-dependent methyltransferase